MKTLDLIIFAPMWVLWTGLGCSTLTGMCLRYLAHARRFERRNELGIEQYKSYGHLLGARFTDWLTGVFGALFLAAALGFMMVVAYRLLMGG